MGGVIITYQRRKYLGVAPKGYQIDHIVPYCLTLDNSKENLQMLEKSVHLKKTIIDKKIIKEFRLRGWIDKYCHYAHELKKPMIFLKEQYLKRYEKYTKKTG